MTCCSSTTATYSTWGNWTACSKSCGTGTQTRTRTKTMISNYDGSTCGASTTETDSRSCNATDCCSSTTNQYGNWTNWSACSKSCGNGTQTRSRTYKKVSTINGQVCQDGLTEAQSQSCNTVDCCSSTTTSYSDWTATSACNKACGGGTQNISRTVTKKSTYNGQVCSTSTETGTRACNTFSCCSSTRSEAITSWQNIGSCNVPNRCGTGTIQQERMVRYYSNYTGEICSTSPEYQGVACTDNSGCCNYTVPGQVLSRRPLMGVSMCIDMCLHMNQPIPFEITYRLVSGYNSSINCGGTTTRVERVHCSTPSDCYRY